MKPDIRMQSYTGLKSRQTLANREESKNRGRRGLQPRRDRGWRRKCTPARFVAGADVGVVVAFRAVAHRTVVLAEGFSRVSRGRGPSRMAKPRVSQEPSVLPGRVAHAAVVEGASAVVVVLGDERQGVGDRVVLAAQTRGSRSGSSKQGPHGVWGAGRQGPGGSRRCPGFGRRRPVAPGSLLSGTWLSTSA